uniref:CCHC-type domain-containing protein n=1 Tax=Glossina pallidipes TaxID=7398 RepID=A0A1B0A3R1_GLOPL
MTTEDRGFKKTELCDQNDPGPPKSFFFQVPQKQTRNRCSSLSDKYCDASWTPSSQTKLVVAPVSTVAVTIISARITLTVKYGEVLFEGLPLGPLAMVIPIPRRVLQHDYSNIWHHDIVELILYALFYRLDDLINFVDGSCRICIYITLAPVGHPDARNISVALYSSCNSSSRVVVIYHPSVYLKKRQSPRSERLLEAYRTTDCLSKREQSNKQEQNLLYMEAMGRMYLDKYTFRQANFAFTSYAITAILVKESTKRVRLTSTSGPCLLTKSAVMIGLEMSAIKNANGKLRRGFKLIFNSFFPNRNELFDMANDLQSISVGNMDRDEPRNQFRASLREQRQMIEQDRQPKTRQDTKICWQCGQVGRWCRDCRNTATIFCRIAESMAQRRKAVVSRALTTNDRVVTESGEQSPHTRNSEPGVQRTPPINPPSLLRQTPKLKPDYNSKQLA